MMATYKRVHVIINPAAGGNESILNILNNVFHQHQVEWDVSITQRADPPQAVAVDGEPESRTTPVEIAVVPQAVQLVVPT